MSFTLLALGKRINKISLSTVKILLQYKDNYHPVIISLSTVTILLQYKDNYHPVIMHTKGLVKYLYLQIEKC